MAVLDIHIELEMWNGEVVPNGHLGGSFLQYSSLIQKRRIKKCFNSDLK